MSKMNQKFMEKYGSELSDDIDDFIDDDYHYKKWLLKIQSKSNSKLNIKSKKNGKLHKLLVKKNG
tara:strand:- start:152 stop:346 length:195 start_codon:yes stop_codon:yes gene_type:complete